MYIIFHISVILLSLCTFNIYSYFNKRHYAQYIFGVCSMRTHVPSSHDISKVLCYNIYDD